MPGKHYKGVLKKNFDFKSEKPKNKKNYNKLTTSQAEKVSEQVTMSTIKKGMPRGIGNYKGSGNFAMKNKVLMKSAKHGEPMQKNFLGKAMMGPGAMLLTKKPKVTSKMVSNPDGTFTETKSDGTRTSSSTFKPAKTKTGAKNVFKNEHGQTRQITGVPSKRKLKKMDKEIKEKQFNNIKDKFSKLSDEELMKIKANKN